MGRDTETEREKRRVREIEWLNEVVWNLHGAGYYCLITWVHKSYYEGI